MIPIGPCETEDWSNDAENSAFITGINWPGFPHAALLQDDFIHAAWQPGHHESKFSLK